MGLQAIPMRADTGPIGGDLSHEFLVLAATGESKVFYDRETEKRKLSNDEIDYSNINAVQKLVDHFTENYARTEETHDPKVFENLPKNRRVEGRGIEVGQIFYFGTKYSEAMGAQVVMPDGSRKAVEMGSHGIGVSRLVGALIEANHDTDGIVWPESVAPFQVSLVNLKQGHSEVDAVCEKIYNAFLKKKVDVLYDDREERAGVKFAAMDLIGVPWRITVGPRGVESGNVEVRDRRTGLTKSMSVDMAVADIIEKYMGLN